MKLSTIAIGAILSLSVNALAQNKVKADSCIKPGKTTKAKPHDLSKQKIDTTQLNNLLLPEPKHTARYCPGCGRG